MSIDPNAPAFPWPDFRIDGKKASGVTIRAHFAAMAMQGLLANQLLEDLIDSGECVYGTIAKDAIKHADALIAELNK
jgi:hypothetical protein